MGKNQIKNILVTGGAGFVGAVLVPKLLKKGYKVSVLDWYIFGRDVFSNLKDKSRLKEIKGDLRDRKLLEKELTGIDAVIHLACISNDPSFELDPTFGKSVNYDATIFLADAAKKKKIKRFIYASSSSVYGVKKEPEVTEDLPLEPLTDYSKYKVLSEQYLLKKHKDSFTLLILRPATVCGYSPRLRLDLTVNILTISALVNKKIIVYGGNQKRPNIHIEDMTDLYLKTLEYPHDKIHGKIFNAGYDNYTVLEIAKMVKRVIGDKEIEIEIRPTDDHRSYHVSSAKIERELGFRAKKSVPEAIRDLVRAYKEGKIPNPMSEVKYYNIKTMQINKDKLLNY
jgi:nucleoside-diphosphate-sugar epimerase